MKKFLKPVSILVVVVMVSLLFSNLTSVTTLNVEGRSISEMDLSGSERFSLSDVTLTDDYYVNAYEKEVEYLLAFDTDKLLAGFRQTAGLDMKGATRYSGWENSLIGGHTIGHYITACVQAYETANATAEQKSELLTKITDLINGLKECQDTLGTGFIFGSTLVSSSNVELQFDNVEKNLTNITTQAWVPWYTMHKIMAGLVSVAQMTDSDAASISQTALSVASNLGDWVYNRTSNWSAATQTTVLSIEYGGMNDCMYDLYLLTGNENHAAAAHSFDQTTLFERVYNSEAGDNALNNLHANTTIPKFLGALKRYIVYSELDALTEDDKIYLEYAEKFWELVVNDHSYITGGNSEWEHFGLDDVLDNERTNCNCETCNSYNMLKLTMYLFEITGDVKYADWYENTFLNSIMSSQNPETGMTTYFQPMASGYFKVYGSEFSHFWCCTGSGMENFSKLGESFYFHKDDTLIINQYISSDLEWADENVTISQTSEIPDSDTATFSIKGDFDGTLAFRLPDWLADDAEILVDGKEYAYSVSGANFETGSNGYAIVAGPFKDGTEITITLPMEVTAHNLPDGENTFAFKYGPVVLSALLGSTDMLTSTTGVNVSIPGSSLIENSYISSSNGNITILSGTIDEFMANINDYLIKDNSSDTLSFTLENTDASLTYVTHYNQYTERYGIYFTFTDDQTAVDSAVLLNSKKSSRLEAFRLDTVQPGYGQYENDELHNMTESGNGSTGSTESGTRRYANADGDFSYTMLVDTEGTSLLATFDAADDGKTIQISVGNSVVYEATLNSGLISGTYDVVIPIDNDILKDNITTVTVDGREKNAVTFTFSGIDGAESASLCDFLYSMKAMSDDSSLASIQADKGTLYYSASRNRYLLKVDEDVTEVNFNFDINSEFGYITIDGAVIDESKAVNLKISDNTYTGYTLIVYAEDQQTFTIYDISIQKDSNDTEPDDELLMYFVDCGDHGPSTVSDGDSFGTHNGVTEQLLGIDPVTGYKWGLIDNPEDQYNGSNVSGGLYTANTWCYEFNDLIDGLAKTVTNRYTKNQYESNIDRHLNYSFELEDGEYTVTMAFSDPWGCSKNPTVYAYAGSDNEQTVFEKADVTAEASGTVTVTNGVLDLNIVSDDLAINVAYITITSENAVTPVDDYVLVSELSNNSGDDNTVNDKSDKSNKSLYIALGAAAVVVIGAGAGFIVYKKKKKK